MDAKRSLGEQIRQAMARRQWRPTGAELARRYNDHYHDAPITEQTASAWLRGRRLPNAANLQALNTLLDTALNVRQSEANQAGKVRPSSAKVAISTRDQGTIDAFLSLPPQGREVVGDLVAGLLRMTSR